MNTHAITPAELTKEQIEEDVRKLGKWFHNINLDRIGTACFARS